MKSKDFKKLLKTYSPQTILTKYMKCEVYLNNRQLDHVIELKEGTSEEGRGGVSFGRTNNI
jgi:hypothetical protein